MSNILQKKGDGEFRCPELSEQVLALGRKAIDFHDVDCLPLEIRELAANPNRFEDWRVLAYTTANSRICQILHANPASDSMLRIVYPDVNGYPLTEGLDRFLSHGLSGQALRDRLEVCGVWLAENFVRPGSSVIDLGGGSGNYAFRALGVKGEVPAGFRWEVLDLDNEALEVCRQRAEDEGLHNEIMVRRGNFMSSKAVMFQHDYAVLIGVLCGMDHTTAVNCLLQAKVHLKPGAELLAATLLIRAFNEDPRTFRLLCNVGGWQLRPKHPAEVQRVFGEAGWDIINIISERGNRPGQYAIVHARLPD